MTTKAPAKPELAAVERASWRIDPDRSSVEFETPTLWGLTTVKGHFDRYRGTLDLGRQPAVELTIDAASLDTGNQMRDRHLRSADFFDVEHHPEVRFVSETAALDGQRLSVRGRLEAGSGSLPLELVATLRRVGEELEVEATTATEHTVLGMSHGRLGMIRGATRLLVRGRLVAGADDGS